MHATSLPVFYHYCYYYYCLFPVMHRRDMSLKLSYGLYRYLDRFYFFLCFPLSPQEALAFWKYAGKKDF